MPRSLTAQRSRLDDPQATPSGRMLADMKRDALPYFRFAMDRARAHNEILQAESLSPDRSAYYAELAERSRKEQASIEAAERCRFRYVSGTNQCGIPGPALNHLAHFRVAHPERGLIVGGLLGDFVKGRLKGEYPARIERRHSSASRSRCFHGPARHHPPRRQPIRAPLSTVRAHHDRRDLRSFPCPAVAGLER
ncbi:MAG: hypothetical protein U5O39_16030 [Gammaproteobacteria bacterium]|nr:hypothetical protein [Gammaproteobacteria bacterium]